MLPINAIVPLAASLTGTLPTMSPTQGSVPAAAIITVADDCHADVRNHFLPQVGRSVSHSHRGEDCAPVIVGNTSGTNGKPADCHRDVRTHRINGVRIKHRHVGSDCSVREVRSGNSF